MKRATLTSPAFIAAFAALLLGAVGLRGAVRILGIHLAKLPVEAPGGRQVHAIPFKIGAWERQGSDEVLSAEALEELDTDNYVSRLYVGTWEGQPVGLDFHAAYYTGMIDTVPHVPERCFVGGGMSITGASRVVKVPLDMSAFSPDTTVDAENGVVWTAFTQDHSRVRLPFGVENLRMNVTRFAAPGVSQEVYAGYFFIANGSVAPKAEDVRSLAFKLTDDYAYFAKVQFTSFQAASAEDLAAQAADFLREGLPEIMRCLPDWVEVQAGRYPEDNPRGRAGAARGQSQ
ncbi:MAG: exosortase-associated EpsI family protein [Phycisphaerales bacterium]|nr:exosortase-associated EpsI family protein [Phycisphaerales bacterium]